MAQPTVTDTFGTLASPSSSSRTVPATTVNWYTLTIGAVPAGGNGYLDLGTRAGAVGQSGSDSMIGVYDSAGNRKATDDDDGNNNYSALSFGATSPTRAGDGNGAAFNGRDGGLGAGTYYVVVVPYFCTFNAANWSVSTTATPFPMQVFANYSANLIPTNPTCSDTVSGSARNDGTGSITITTSVVAGQNPLGVSHTVTVDTSALGDVGTQPKVMVEGPTGTFNYTAGVASGTAAGTYTLTTNVRETSPSNRSTSCTVNAIVINPPTGSCCVSGSCQILTQASCTSQGGTYGGDATTCTACSCVADVPGNDRIEGSIELSVGSSETGTTCGATIDSGYSLCNSQTISAPGVWYNCTGTGNTMTATMCGGPSYDSRMSVYCVQNSSLTCVGGNDDSSCGLLSTVAFCTQESAQYYVLVHGFSANTGAFQISLTDDSTPCNGGIQCLPTGACCTPTGCTITTVGACGSLGGTYNGDGSVCNTVNNSFASADSFPIAIPDYTGGVPGVASSTIVVPANSGTIAGLGVKVGLHHTFAGDLIGTLSNGTNTVTLFNRTGTLYNLVGEYVFLDSAAGGLGTGASGTDITTGTYKPADPLSALDGVPYAGTWTLLITDNAGIDIGTIDSFAFVTLSSNCSSCPACAADYNSDGGVDGADIGAFFPDWESSAACADVNQDGGVDGADVEAFFHVWEQGGC